MPAEAGPGGVAGVSGRRGAIGVDVGGTFTDTTVVASNGRVVEGKALTTRHDLVGGVLASIANAAEALGMGLDQLLADTLWVGHGTTVGLNALLTDTGARVGVLVTEGFEGVLPIARLNWVRAVREEDRTEMRRWRKPRLLVHRSRILGIPERVDRNGDVLEKLDEERARAAIRRLKADGVETVAVCCLWSIRNPAHEQRLRTLVGEEVPDAFVAVSSEISQRIGEYERWLSTVLTSYVGPLFDHYLGSLEGHLRDRGFTGSLYGMQMGGGVQPVHKLRRHPLSCINSGPVGGLFASQHTGAAAGHPHIIATDVGGTSFDVGLVVAGQLTVASQPRIERYEIATPVVDVESIGTGGGSIARVDPDLGALMVGPASAGADPGPACYGRGGRWATVTDAAVVLGYLRHAGRELALDRSLATQAVLRSVGEPLGMSAQEAAEGILRVANAQMADLIRRLTVLRGYDVGTFALYAYGGAAPQYVGRYAAELGAARVVIPRLASVFSAYGAATSDLETQVARDLPVTPLASAAELVAGVLAELERQAREEFADVIEATDATVEVQRVAGLRFKRQVRELPVPLAPGPVTDATMAMVERTYRDEYERLVGSGSAGADTPLEVVSLAVRVRVPLSPAAATAAAGSGPGAGAVPMGPLPAPPVAAPTSPTRWRPATETRRAWFGGVEVDCDVRGVADLEGGRTLAGPGFLELPTTTVVVYPGQTLTLAADGNLELHLGEGRQ